MTDRTVRVSLVANVNNYLSGMEQARKKTLETSKSSQDAAAKFEAQNKAMTEVGLGVVAFGALAAAGVAIAVKKFADFDQAMSQVQAATHESAENMGLLRDAALDAGARTVFSATEAANAIEELGKAGLTTQDILTGGLDGALDLAAAGGLSVADAASTAAIAMKQFGLAGSDLPHVADLLAAGAGKAVGDVSDLSMALNQAGLVANGAGQSIEDTTGVLAAFADAGLLGSDAGTSLKSALIALQAPTDKSRAVMEKYNLSFYDGAGQMLSYDKIAGQLQSQLSGLTDEQRNAALAQIFGNDALRSANVLYEQGAAGITGYIKQTNDAGYAAETAAIRLDNLKGDVEQLGGAFDTALIKSGSAANDSLRAIVQTATDMLTAFGGAPAPMQATAFALAGVAAAVALLGGGLLVAVPKIAAFQASMATLKETAPAVAAGLRVTAIAMAGVTAALVAATVIIGAFIQNQAEAKARIDALTETLDENTGAITKNTRAAAYKRLQDEGIYDAAKKAGISIKEVNAAVFEGGDALDSYNKKSEAYRHSFEQQASISEVFAGTNVKLRDGVNNLRFDIDASKDAFDNLSEATDTGAQSTFNAADAYLAASDGASGLTDQVRALTDEINKANGVGQDAISANIAYQDAVAKVAEQIEGARAGAEGYAFGLDLATKAGRDNYGALLDQAKGGIAAADAQFTLDGNTKNYVAALQANRDKILQNARDLGATDAELSNISSTVVNMPTQKEIDVLADTTSARTALENLIAGYQNRSVTLRAVMAGADRVTQANGSVLDFYGRGGLREHHTAQIAPAGAWRVWAEPETGGESYIPLAPAKRARSLEIWQETGRRLGVQGFASGGYVQPQYVSGGGSSSGITAAGATFNSTVQVVPQPGKSVWQQSLEAARWVRFSFGG